MKKVLVFGVGSTGQRIINQIRNKVNIVGLLDNDSSTWGKKIEEIEVLGNAFDVEKVSYDEIIIASLTGMENIKAELLEVGVDASKINTEYVYTQVNARINFIRNYIEVIDKDKIKNLAVAEGGVFQGEFAKEINSCFPNNDLYLFDTFEGFDERDTDLDKEKGYSKQGKGHLNITSEEIVLEKLPFREKAIIRKGWFPETVTGVEDRTFAFVNLDFDLYMPILEGIKFFYPRIVAGGILLIHDYFNPGYLGVKEAVKKYEEENHIELIKLPIGDACSIAIIKR